MIANHQQPLVSIGLPVYNGENYIEEAINSILDQTYQNIELIISDNASTDNTVAICKKYCEKDKRIKLHCFEENFGAARNYNRTFELATGKYFKWAAHDDYIEENFVEKCVEILEKDPEIHLCNTYRRFIGENKETFRWDKFEQIEFTDSSPVKRFKRYLHNFRFREPDADVVFGVCRTDSLAKTQLIANFHSSDLTLVAEVILLGKIHIIEEFLFYRRFHKKMSIFAHVKKSERAKWFDPKRKHAFTVVPYLIWYTQFLKFILKSELSIIDKSKLLVATQGWLVSRTYSRIMIKLKLRRPSDFGYYSLNY